MNGFALIVREKTEISQWNAWTSRAATRAYARNTTSSTPSMVGADTFASSVTILAKTMGSVQTRDAGSYQIPSESSFSTSRGESRVFVLPAGAQRGTSAFAAKERTTPTSRNWKVTNYLFYKINLSYAYMFFAQFTMHKMRAAVWRNRWRIQLILNLNLNKIFK